MFSHGGRTPEGLDALAWCRQVAELGAGEILLTSRDRDSGSAHCRFGSERPGRTAPGLHALREFGYYGRVRGAVFGSSAITRAMVTVGISLLALAAVARADGDKLRILGAQGTLPTITRASTTPAVAHDLVIQSLVKEPVTFAVDVGPFVDPRGTSVVAASKLDGAAARTATVAPLGTVTLSISALLLVEAEYASEITLSYGDTRQLARLVVIRELEPLGVQMSPPEPVRAEASTFGTSSATLEITLQETTGRTITLDTFELTSFTRKTSDARHQAHTAFRIDPRAVPDAAAASADRARGGHDAGGNARSAMRVTLNGHQTVRVPTVLDELDAAGEYSGTIQIRSPGGKPVEQSFTLVLRESRWTVFGCLLIGSLLSFAWQLAMTRLRPRLVLERRLGLLARQLEQRRADPSVDPDERSLLWGLGQAVAAELDAAQWKRPAKPDDAVALLEDRYELAELWIQRHQELRGIEPSEARARVAPTLDTARATIIAAPATALTALRTTLDELPAVAHEAVKSALSSRINTIRLALAAMASDPAEVGDPATVADITQRLEQATRQLEDPDLAEAIRSYQEARRRWLPMSLDALDALLSSDAPPGFDAPSWQVTVEAIRPDIVAARGTITDDPDTAIVHYRRAQLGYLVAAADGLRRGIDGALGKLDTSAEDPVIAARAAALTTARTDAAAARAAAYAGKIDEASAALERARDGHQRGTQRRTLGVGGARGDRPLAAIPEGVAGPRAAARTTPSFRPAASAGRWIVAIDGVALVFAVVVASLLGITLLWDPNPTWGGSRDHITAVLWGLGLHGASFTGAAAVGERLFGKRAEAS